MTKSAIMSALNLLNKTCNGKMEKWSWNYPTLQQRLSHVENLSG
jgi:hypothetical protein